VGINVVDLGLIRAITVNGKGVEVRMVLMCPDCPLAGYMVGQVRRKVRRVVGDERVEVVLLDEAWDWNDAAPRLIWGDGI
jgi:metal-sulfur cluster biosynthetic enzyme